MEINTQVRTNNFEFSEKDYLTCEKCGKVFKIKSSLSRHILRQHGQVDVLKLRLKNDHLELKADLLKEQIKFLKDLIIIQESLKHPSLQLSVKAINSYQSLSNE